jgi:6-phospho-3-hexuloisomerase
MTDWPPLWDGALDELRAVLHRIDPQGIEDACALIAGAPRVMGFAGGREGLMLRALVMRLAHLGKWTAYQGDMAAPPLAEGDLLICSAGPGGIATVAALMGQARKAGASVLYLTAEPDRPPADLATRTLVIPAQTMARDTGAAATSVLPMGSLYEGALFLLFEAMVLRLRDLLDETPESMRARHTNME